MRASQSPAITTKRIYDAPAKDEGIRVLVMRLWPRGIKKTAVDLWLKDLGADMSNIKAFKAGRLTWPEMKKRYLRGLKDPPAASAIARLETLARQRRVTLLCSCKEEARCHRGVLKSLLDRRRPATL